MTQTTRQLVRKFLPLAGIVVVVLGLTALFFLPGGPPAGEGSGCLANLRALEAAKVQWALDQHKLATETPTDRDLFGPGKPFSARPKCPQGGEYTVGAVCDKPRCSFPGHAY
jgi:hypothetical protein